VTEQTEKLRGWIRSGEVNKEKNNVEWEWAVARVYEAERREEALVEMVRESEKLELYERHD